MGKVTIAESITEELRLDILSGRLSPRERLIEEQLAERFEVSRTPIREAINRLAEVGLVRVIPYCGAEVNVFDIEHMFDVYQVRKVLEGLIVELATPHIDSGTLRQLRTLLEKMDIAMADEDFNAYGKMHNEFHSLMYESCPNKFLKNMISELLDSTHVFRRSSWITGKSVRTAQEFHTKTIEAIENKDAFLAKKYNEEHIEVILNDLSKAKEAKK